MIIFINSGGICGVCVMKTVGTHCLLTTELIPLYLCALESRGILGQNDAVVSQFCVRTLVVQ